MSRLLSLCLLILICAQAQALSHDEVIAGAGQMYRQRMRELEQRHVLDDDAIFLARVKKITRTLVLQANNDYSAFADWNWEVHTSSDAEEMAYCMAGGKIFISQSKVQALNLNDAELAMLLSHEMQHALIQHNLKEYVEAIRLFPAWKNRPFAELEDAVDNDAMLIQALAEFNFNQEIEADMEGLKFAWRAGWKATDLAKFFKKLGTSNTMKNFDSVSHPAPARRWKAARDLAGTLDAHL